MSLKNVSAINYKKIIIFIAGIIIMFFLWKLICRIVDKNAFIIIMEMLYPVGELYYNR